MPILPAYLTIVALGFLLGMRHAMDPDHVVAVTTIVSRERTILHAALIGALWGLGHTLTVFGVGSAIILLKLTIPPALGLTMELLVALMLVLLGVLNLTGVMGRVIQWLARRGFACAAHVHVLFGRLIVHTHETETYAARWSRGRTVADGWTSHWWTSLGWFHILRPLVVGIVHGLAGSAAVALLVLTTIASPYWAIGYLLIFGLGTISGMMLITAVIAIPFAFSLRHFVGLNRSLAIASGLISVSFGLFLCYRIGISDGLFSGNPNWMPH
jgi:high-affinity nickel-transport protein